MKTAHGSHSGSGTASAPAAALPAATALAAALLALASPAPAQQPAPADSGRYEIVVGDRQVGVEYFAIRREGSSLRAAARLTAAEGNASALPAPTMETRTQTGADYEPTLFELRTQLGERLAIRGLRSGQRFQLRTTSDEGERWREFLVPSGLVILPRHFTHSYWFLFRAAEERGREGLTALLPMAGERVKLAVEELGSDAVRIGEESRAATRYRLTVGGETHEVWVDDRDRVLKVRIAGRDWTATRAFEQEEGGGG